MPLPPNSIVFYNGVPLEDLTKEELIEAIHEMSRQADMNSQRHKDTLDMWALVNKARESNNG